MMGEVTGAWTTTDSHVLEALSLLFGMSELWELRLQPLALRDPFLAIPLVRSEVVHHPRTIWASRSSVSFVGPHWDLLDSMVLVDWDLMLAGSLGSFRRGLYRLLMFRYRRWVRSRD